MKSINSTQHKTLIKTLQQLEDILSATTANTMSLERIKNFEEVKDGIVLLKERYLEYESLLEQLSHTIEQYDRLNKHLRFSVLAPALRILRKNVEPSQAHYFLIRENLLETKKL